MAGLTADAVEGSARSFVTVVLADCVDAISSFTDVMYFGWLLYHSQLGPAWRVDTMGAVHFYTSLTVLASSSTLAFLFLAILPKSIPATVVVATPALLMFPPMTWAAITMFLADMLGPSATQICLAVSISLAMVKSVATGLLKMRMLPSRWAYITASSYASLLVSLMCAFSPFMLYYLSSGVWDLPDDFPIARMLKHHHLLYDSRVRAVFLLRIPLALVQLVLQLICVHNLHTERVVQLPKLPASLRFLLVFGEAEAKPALAPPRDEAGGSSCLPRRVRRARWWAARALAWVAKFSMYLLTLGILSFATFNVGLDFRLVATGYEKSSWLYRQYAPEKLQAAPKAPSPPGVGPTGLAAAEAARSRSIAGKSVYMLMVDRFAKPWAVGGRSDCGGDTRWCHGSLQGVISRLDYVENMGFDCVWITPVLEQPASEPCHKPGGCSVGYHGYWTTNFYNIDRRYGTSADLIKLSANLKSRGMCLVMDVVLNHVRPISRPGQLAQVYPFDKPEYFNQYGRRFNATTQTQETFGEYLKHPGQALRYTSLGCSLPLDASKCPGADEHEIREGWFYDLADLNQSHTFVRSELKAWVAHMVQSYGIDALRLDTTPYMDKAFLAELQQVAGVEVIGEVMTSNIPFHASYTKDPETGEPVLAGLLNFPMARAAASAFCPGGGESERSVLQRGSEGRYGSGADIMGRGDPSWRPDWSPGKDTGRDKAFASMALAAERRRMADGMGNLHYAWREQVGRGDEYTNRDLLANFIDNHDTERIQRRCQFDQGRVSNALTMVMLTRGVPVIYYGTEQGYGHKDARRALWPSGYRRNSPIYRLLRALNRVRRTELSAAPGSPTPEPDLLHLNATDQLAFTRRLEEDAAPRVVVLLNNRRTTPAVWQPARERRPVTYCTEDGSPILPGADYGWDARGFVAAPDELPLEIYPPFLSETQLAELGLGKDGEVPLDQVPKWEDAISGWRPANYTAGDPCIEVPDALPKVMVRVRGNATQVRTFDAPYAWPRVFG